MHPYARSHGGGGLYRYARGDGLPRVSGVRLQPVPVWRVPFSAGLDLRDDRFEWIGSVCRYWFGVAVAVMRNRFSPDLATVEALGRIVAEAPY